MLVLDFYPNGIGRGVEFKVEGGRGLERTVGLEREELIVPIPCPADEVIGDDPGLRVGRIEFTNCRTDWLVFGNGQRCGGIQVRGGGVGRSDLE